MDYSSFDLELLQELVRYKKTHKAEFFKPYPFQNKFYEAGAKYKARFLMAGNRCGKSHSLAQEMSFHLTGKYPSYWKGKRFNTPILAWAVGITADSTRKVLQKELLGTIIGRDENEIGTGSIPRDCIDFNTIERDGNTVRTIRVLHTSGGYSTLEFRSTQQGEYSLMGPSVHFIWLDEQDPYNDTKIFAQCVVRTATTDGQVVITATPEAGRTELVDRFLTEGMGQSDTLYCQNTTWDEAEHLTPEIQKELLSSIPEWQHVMRKTGLPVVGKGIVFDVADGDITCDEPFVRDWWEVLWAADIGKTNDPSVLTLAFKNTDDNTYIIAEQKVFDEDRSPDGMAKYINSHRFRKAPFIPPHDAQDGQDGSAGYASLLRQRGVNVKMEPFRNPNFVLTSMVGNNNSSVRAIAPGLHYMLDYFKSGKLKVHKDCQDFFKEKHTYHRNDRGNLCGKDHCIDSVRYAFMSLLGNRGIPVGQCGDIPDLSFNNGFTSYDEAVSFDYRD